MVIQIDPSDLKRVTRLMARAAADSRPIAEAVHVAIDGQVATFTATNFEATLQTSVEVDNPAGPFRILVGAKRLADVAARCTGPVVNVVPGEGTGVTLASGRWKAKLPTIPATEFDNWLPRLPEGATFASFDGDTFLVSLGQVIVAAHKDRAQLTGVHFEPEDGGLRMVATDSYRLASRFLPGAQLEAEATVPAKTLAVLADIHQPGDRVEVWLGDDSPAHRGHAVLRTGQTTIDALLLTEKYPPWRGLVAVEDKAVGQLTIDDPAELAASVLRNGNLFGGDLTLVHLDLGKGKVRASFVDLGESDERVDIGWTGPELSITFNARLLAEALRTFTGPVVAAVCDDMKPMVIRPADDPGHDDLHLIMPVRSN